MGNKDIKKIGHTFVGATIGGYTFETPSISLSLLTLADVLNLVVDILSFAVYFSAFVAVIMIVYAGFLFITAGGDPDKISTGSKTLTAAIVGMVIVFLAKTIIAFVITEFLL